MVTKERKKKTDPVIHVVSPYALFFELEGPLTGGRRLMFDTLQRLLKKEKLGLTETAFARHGLSQPPALCVKNLIASLDGEGVSEEKMTEAFFSALRSAAAGAMKPAGTLVKLIEATRAHGAPSVALSCLPAEVATLLAEKSGLTARGVQVQAFHDAEKAFPSRDIWLEVCRSLTRSPRRCFALISTAVACQTALAADLRVMALPDDFTACQDFGGAEWVCETPVDLSADDVIARMVTV
ncbi:MAG: hypothetical protein NTV49_00745 [Kiritimatiellaeota bacterium]|nr:hypothetical protein [Kiritimatiellota bacterium]